MISALVVDDSLTVRMDLSEILSAAGFEVTLAKNIAEARAILDRTTFPLVVLDVILPDGDGVQILGEMRKADAHATSRVILLASEADVRDRVANVAAEADAYIDKPYDKSVIVERALALVRPASPPLAPAPAAEKTTILLVDDSVTFREALRDALEGAGYGVVIASTGEEGLAVATSVRPNAIVVDGVMPGIDGVTVIRRIRLDTALRRIPCLLLTGSGDLVAEIRALDAGADAFLRKEEDVKVVLGRLAAVLRSASTAAEEPAPSVLPVRKFLAALDGPRFEELAAILRQDGYDVVAAPSGQAAIELLAVEPVDLVFLDPGSGGLDTCRRIKNATGLADTPIMLLADTADRGAMLEGLAAGADDWVTMSGDPDILRARVRAQIRRKQIEDERRRNREQLLRGEIAAGEARAVRELAETRAKLLDELRKKNEELEAFSYSVSHDLRAPLRTIDGFVGILAEDHASALDAEGRRCLDRVRDGARRMDKLICDLLSFSRVTNVAIRRTQVDLGHLAGRVVERLRVADPARVVDVVIASDLAVLGDPALLEIVIENLVRNAWKFTSKRETAKIEITKTADRPPVYVVRDDGAGFDMTFAKKLFGVFQRLHSDRDFEGTGVGLATVRRIVDRHGGRIWAEGRVNEGATFFFTLGDGKEAVL